MKNVGDIIKDERQALGLSQSVLANLSTVSYPSVQLIESNRGNPSIKTVERLFDVLGMELNCLQKEADWEYLSYWGLPLTISPNEKQQPFHIERFYLNIKLACRELKDQNITPKTMRKRRAIQSLLLVLEEVDTTNYHRYLAKSEYVIPLYPDEIDAKLSKLKKIVLTKINLDF